MGIEGARQVGRGVKGWFAGYEGQTGDFGKMMRSMIHEYEFKYQDWDEYEYEFKYQD